MWLRLFFLCVFGACPNIIFAETAVEGRVVLPKSHSAPLMNKRYEIVTRGGVLSTDPPIAVVYLEGSFPKAGALPTKQIQSKRPGVHTWIITRPGRDKGGIPES